MGISVTAAKGVIVSKGSVYPLFKNADYYAQ